MREEEPGVLLTELPEDALCSVLAWLEPRDLAAASLVCRRLSQVASQDRLWQPLCLFWVQRQPSAAWLASAAGFASAPLPTLQRSFGTSSFRQLYQVLAGVGAWPVGVWYATRDDGGFQPRGQLLVVEQEGRSFIGSLVSSAAAHGPGISQDDIWELDEWFRIDVGEHGAATLRWLLPGDSEDSLAVAPSSEELAVYQGFAPHKALPLPQGYRLLEGSPRAHPAPEKLVLGFRRLPLGPGDGEPARELPLALLAAGPDRTVTVQEGADILRALEGVYCACYGPHGMEVLLLRMAGPGDSPPRRCTTSGVRLQGMKVVGDPNVPALEYSFVVDAAQGRLGPFNPADDPFPEEGGFARPVLSFWQSVTTILQLDQRPVHARFRALGQINQTPGVWDPEWVAATLVVYEPGHPCPFTIVFEDQGVHVRHGMDFFQLQLPLGKGRGGSGADTDED